VPDFRQEEVMSRTSVTTIAWSTFLLVVFAVVGCRSLRPETIAAGETCFRCRHVIADARLGAEMLNGPLPTKYRGPNCLARYLKAHPDPHAQLFVTDYNSGALFDPARAWLVPVITNDRTGARDYRAYQARSAADAAARELHTSAVRWTTVMEQAQL
jgi:hypothetical protein